MNNDNRNDGSFDGSSAAEKKTADVRNTNPLGPSWTRSACEMTPTCDEAIRESDGFHETGIFVEPNRCRAGGGKEVHRSWDTALAEAISVIEWDVRVEISTEPNREGFCRTLKTIIKNALAGDSRRRRVRDSNPIFKEKVGRYSSAAVR